MLKYNIHHITENSFLIKKMACYASVIEQLLSVERYNMRNFFILFHLLTYAYNFFHILLRIPQETLPWELLGHCRCDLNKVVFWYTIVVFFGKTAWCSPVFLQSSARGGLSRAQTGRLWSDTNFLQEINSVPWLTCPYYSYKKFQVKRNKNISSSSMSRHGNAVLCL